MSAGRVCIFLKICKATLSHVIPGPRRDPARETRALFFGSARPPHKASSINCFLLLFFGFTPLTANAITLQWPLDCILGENCFIQNYVDHDTTPAAHDYTCHDATYDGHDGTDIRLRNLAAMRAGITVKAVADGTVLGTRNNVADVSLRDANAPDIKDRECGNGVRLQHAEGFVTQYCHMQKGSIRVVTGQPVKAGDALGLVGLSGETEFPHLHLGVWKDNVKMDPFTADSITSACNAKAGAPQLWATPIPYQSTALLNDGMTGMAPTKERMQDRPVSQSELPANGPAIIYWVEVMALQKGDVLTLAIASPDGSVFAKKTITLDGSKAEYFGFLGRKNSSGSFAQGLYHPSITVMRDGQPALHVERELAVQ